MLPRFPGEIDPILVNPPMKIYANHEVLNVGGLVKSAPISTLDAEVGGKKATKIPPDVGMTGHRHCEKRKRRSNLVFAFSGGIIRLV